MNTLSSKLEEIYNLLSMIVWLALGIILCVVVLLLALRYDHPVAEAVVGGAAFFASLLFATWYHEWKLARFRNNRPLDPERVVRIPVAQIANDLAPLVDKLSLENGRLRLVGHDGEYILGKNRRLWRNSLSRWLKKGLDIEYILMDPSREIIDSFTKIKEQAKEEDGRLKIFIFECADKPVELERLKTCHPTLFCGDDGTRAMWIEEDHQPGCRFAYDVVYVPPGAMNDEQNSKFEEYEHMIEYSKEHCREIAA